ncbi:type I restriction endonuclease, partial [Corynebacterium evansiae]
MIRQVHFDPASNETIDLVLTVNGIPVVTMELRRTALSP